MWMELADAKINTKINPPRQTYLCLISCLALSSTGRETIIIHLPVAITNQMISWTYQVIVSHWNILV
jgi:hypothetical protein